MEVVCYLDGLIEAHGGDEMEDEEREKLITHLNFNAFESSADVKTEQDDCPLCNKIIALLRQKRTVSRAEQFVKHIEGHLEKYEIFGKVQCKICGKDIDEIYESELGYEIEEKKS